MATDSYNLAIETSSPIDSITVGNGDELVETVTLPNREPGRSSNLMPAIADLFERRGIDRRSLDEIYVSVGPGSFTGLRIGIATAQMLAKVLNARMVAVPTIDVMAQNVATSDRPLLVCLNQKRDTVYAATFESSESGWRPTAPPAVQSIAPMLADAPRPVQVLSQTVLNFGEADLSDVEILPVEQAIPSSETVWHLGRDAARQGAYTAPSQLLPIYARIPEAVELWDKRHN